MNKTICSKEELNERLLQEVVKHYLIDNKFAESLRFETNEPLNKLFPEPENRLLKTTWNNCFAGVLVFRHNKLVCIIEPELYVDHKSKEIDKRIQDKKEDQIIKMNDVNILRIILKDTDELDLPVTKRLIKKYIYKEGGEIKNEK